MGKDDQVGRLRQPLQVVPDLGAKQRDEMALLIQLVVRSIDLDAVLAANRFHDIAAMLGSACIAVDQRSFLEQICEICRPRLTADPENPYPRHLRVPLYKPGVSRIDCSGSMPVLCKDVRERRGESGSGRSKFLARRAEEAFSVILGVGLLAGEAPDAGCEILGVRLEVIVFVLEMKHGILFLALLNVEAEAIAMVCRCEHHAIHGS